MDLILLEDTCAGALDKSWEDRTPSSSHYWKGLVLCEPLGITDQRSEDVPSCDLWFSRALCLYSALTAAKISFAWFLRVPGNILPSLVATQNITNCLFPDPHRRATEKQHLREGSMSFLLKQVPFTHSTCSLPCPRLQLHQVNLLLLFVQQTHCTS